MTKKFIWIFFAFILGFDVGYAQEVSGEKKIQTYYFNEQSGQFQSVPQTEQGVDSLLAISRASLNTDLKRALQAAQQGLDLAKSLQYKQGVGYAHLLVGVSHQRLGSHMQALQHYLSSLNLFKQIDDTSYVGSALNGIAILYMHRKNYDKAKEYYKKAINKFESIGSKEQKAIASMNLGLVYYYQGQYDQSLKYYKQTVQVLRDSAANKFIEMVAITNMGNSYIETEDYIKAENYLLQAIDFFDTKGLTRNQSGAYIYLAKLYNRVGNYNDALVYASGGLAKAKSIGHMQYIIEGYGLLADIYANQDNFRQAYRLYRQFDTVQDSILNNEMSDKLNAIQVDFRIQKKNQQIQLLEKEAQLKEAEIQQQRLWKLLMIIGFGLSAIIAALLFGYNRQKRKANDLLEQKNEKIIDQNRKLVKLNEEKNEFMGIAAHDLRSPLSGIKGAVDLLKAGNMDKKDAQKFYETIGISTGRMLDLIDNLLDVNVAENNLGHLKITRVRAADVIQDVVNSYEKQAKEKNIDLITPIDQNSAPVAADWHALHRIFDNLISNAVKYSPAGSTVEVVSQKQDDQMKLSVKDNGPGIPEEEQENLFKRYSRLSNKPTADETSTGLGLFIVKRLVEKMDGSISYNSKVGEGSEFIIELPLTVQNEF